ncbi:MAG: rod shape-determining protein MreD [Myxococcales bacterium]|nr:rod shape-determining protein MreD [Myxococcales bacterium]
MISSLSVIGFGFALLVLQTALATLVPMHSFAPNLMLPIAIFLGVSPQVPLVRGASICFVLGYFLDAFCGNPMGLQTFVLVASVMVARGAGLRLFPQGRAFQLLLTFLMALLSGITVVALRAIFEEQQIPGLGEDLGERSMTLLRSSLATAVVSPLLFAGTRRAEGGSLPKAEERAASAA